MINMGFKYFPLVWAGLWRKKARTILTAFSIITAFFLFGMLQGINLGIDSVTNQIRDTSRLRVSNRINRIGTLPSVYAPRIANVQGVASVTPLTALAGAYQQPRNIIIAFGVDVESWFKIYPEFKAPPDQLQAIARTRNGAMVGVALAERYHLKVGDRLPLQSFNVTNSDGSKNWEFSVVGIYDIEGSHDSAANVLLNFDYLNEARVDNKNTANQIEVKLADPDRFAVTAAAIDELFANSSVQTMTQNDKDFIQSTLNQIGDINFFVNGIVGAVLFTLLFLTANTMMQSVRQRIPEFAVLKTLGFSDAATLMLVLIEALILSLTAAGLGLAAASIAMPVLMRTVGTVIGLSGLPMPTVVFLWGALIALVLAFASGVPPAWRAKRLKIVDALSRR
jgi:putative ABC transport system permease protein